MTNEYRIRRRRKRIEHDERLYRRPDFQEAEGEQEADAVGDEFLRDPAHQSAALSVADGETRERMVNRLQAEHGNRYLQRLVLQRNGQQQGGASAAPNLLDPNMMRRAALRVIEQQQAPVRQWIEQNTARLQGLTLAEIVLLVRHHVPEAANLAEAEIQSIAREWASHHHVSIPTASAGSARPTFSLADSQAVSNVRTAVQGAFKLAVEGIDIVEGQHGRINVSVSGVTAELRQGGERAGEQGQSGAVVSGVLNWGGSVGVATAWQGWHFSGTLSSERWSLNLSFPGDSAVPDLTQLTRVFQEGEKAMRGMAVSVANAGDIHAAQDAIRSQLPPVREAVEAVSSLAQAQRLSLGISVSGPMAPADESRRAAGHEGGFEVQATLTLRF